MTLCSLCGGPLYTPSLVSLIPFDPHPYCSRCGKYIGCLMCRGKGYIMIENLLPQYCSRCGRKISRKVRSKCLFCHGTGRVFHVCLRSSSLLT